MNWMRHLIGLVENSVFEAAYTLPNVTIQIFRNLSPDELEDAAERIAGKLKKYRMNGAMHSHLRGLIVGRDIYWTDAYHAVHADMAAALGVEDYVGNRFDYYWSEEHGPSLDWDEEWPVERWTEHPQLVRLLPLIEPRTVVENARGEIIPVEWPTNLAWRVEFKRFSDLHPLSDHRKGKVFAMPFRNWTRTYHKLTLKDYSKVKNMPTQVVEVPDDALVGDMRLIDNALRMLVKNDPTGAAERRAIEYVRDAYEKSLVPYSEFVKNPSMFERPEILIPREQLKVLPYKVTIMPDEVGDLNMDSGYILGIKPTRPLIENAGAGKIALPNPGETPYWVAGLASLTKQLQRTGGFWKSWTQGGCFAFAEALHEVFGGELWGVCSRDGGDDDYDYPVEHAMLKVGDRFYDYTGVVDVPAYMERLAQERKREMFLKPASDPEVFWFEDEFMDDEQMATLRRVLRGPGRVVEGARKGEDPAVIIQNAKRAGFSGFGGLCGEAAVAINRVVFGGQGKLVGAFNEAFLDHADRLLGHVAVLHNGVYWDADGRPKHEDEITSWGMLDPDDLDYVEAAAEAGIDWNDETASEVAIVEFENEAEILERFGTEHLAGMIATLEKGKR